MVAVLLLFGSHNSFADQLEFAWDASDGDGEVKSYVICWGPSEGDYPNCEDVGNVLQATVDVPLDSWIISKAIDTNDNESDPSNFVIYGTDLPIQPASNGQIHISDGYNDIPLNILKNGSFEIDSNEDGNPDDWRTAEPVEMDCEIKIHENCSARIDSVSDENNNNNIQFVDLQPNTSYLLSGWIKTENVTREGAQIYLYNHGIPGYVPIKIKGTNDWKYYEMEYKTGNDPSKAHVSYRIKHGQGTAWFDDIKLVKKK